MIFALFTAFSGVIAQVDPDNVSRVISDAREFGAATYMAVLILVLGGLYVFANFFYVKLPESKASRELMATLNSHSLQMAHTITSLESSTSEMHKAISSIDESTAAQAEVSSGLASTVASTHEYVHDNNELLGKITRSHCSALSVLRDVTDKHPESDRLSREISHAQRELDCNT